MLGWSGEGATTYMLMREEREYWNRQESYGIIIARVEERA